MIVLPLVTLSYCFSISGLVLNQEFRYCFLLHFVAELLIRSYDIMPVCLQFFFQQLFEVIDKLQWKIFLAQNWRSLLEIKNFWNFHQSIQIRYLIFRSLQTLPFPFLPMSTRWHRLSAQNLLNYSLMGLWIR